MKNVGESVLQKLKNHARSTHVDMQAVLRRYVQERLLHRLSVSGERDEFCLKGGVLLSAYNDGDLLRPTEDIDFNGFDADGTVERLRISLNRIVEVDVGDDGVRFDASSMKIVKDRTGIVPGGKVTMVATVGTARVDVKVDVGFGNAITPHTLTLEVPTLLGDVVPRPVVRAYPLETVIAEKLHAMAQFGGLNTRIKDHFDILVISRSHAFDGATLAEAVANTFTHQGRAIPERFASLGEEYAAANGARWGAFLGNVAPGLTVTLGEAVAEVEAFVTPFVDAAREGSEAPGRWDPAAGWPEPAASPTA